MVKVNHSMFFAFASATNGKRSGGESVGLLQVDSNHTSIFQISELLGNAETAEQSGTVAAALLAKVKTHGRWTKADQVALEPLMTSLVAGFNGQTQKEHESDQTHWNGEKARQEQCHTTASNKFKPDGEVFVGKQELVKRKAKLKLCHAIDMAWIRYQDARQCQATEDISLKDVTDHHSALGIAVTSLSTNVGQYQSEFSGSINLLPSSCTGDQVRFEEQMCLVRRLKRWSCEAQGQCITDVGLANTKTHLQSSQENRQVSKLSFKKVICQINFVLGLTTDGEWQEELGQTAVGAAEHCQSVELDANDLVLDLVMPAAEHCNVDQDPEVAIYPSESSQSHCLAWRQQEYKNWGLDYTVPTNCQATCADAPDATAAFFVVYPGYGGALTVGGTVTASYDGTGLVDMSFSLSGVGTGCVSSSAGLLQVPEPVLKPVGVPNACGIHIHSGISCDQHKLVGGHYYGPTSGGADPWLPMTYQANNDGTALSSMEVAIGAGQDISGRTVVAHDKSGGRIACAVLPYDPDWVKLGAYPESTGPMTVTGFVKASYDEGSGVVDMSFSLFGGAECEEAPVGVPNACGIHIHSGGSCDQHKLVGGHYYGPTAGGADPWLSVVYQANEGGTARSNMKIPIGAGQHIDGRTIVVHDKTGGRIACAVLPYGVVLYSTEP